MYPMKVKQINSINMLRDRRHNPATLRNRHPGKKCGGMVSGPFTVEASLPILQHFGVIGCKLVLIVAASTIFPHLFHLLLHRKYFFSLIHRVLGIIMIQKFEIRIFRIGLRIHRLVLLFVLRIVCTKQMSCRLRQRHYRPHK
jgi:hypothetical protein